MWPSLWLPYSFCERSSIIQSTTHVKLNPLLPTGGVQRYGHIHCAEELHRSHSVSWCRREFHASSKYLWAEPSVFNLVNLHTWIILAGSAKQSPCLRALCWPFHLWFPFVLCWLYKWEWFAWVSLFFHSAEHGLFLLEYCIIFIFTQHKT